MLIRKVMTWQVNGQSFPSLAKAKDHIDSEVNRHLQNALTKKGFTVTECIKVTESILAMRNVLATLLTVETETDSSAFYSDQES